MSLDCRTSDRETPDGRKGSAVDIGEMLRQVVEIGASDLHLKVGRPPVVRVDGILEPCTAPALSEADLSEIVEHLMPDFRRDQFSSRGEIDFAYEDDDIGRFRVNIFRQQGTIALAMRYVRPEVPSLADLGMPPVVSRLCDEPGLRGRSVHVIACALLGSGPRLDCRSLGGRSRLADPSFTGRSRGPEFREGKAPDDRPR